jgi:uncharacterized membrane protein YfcA
MNRVKTVLAQAYVGGVAAAPIIGANVAVWTEHRQGDTFRDVALIAICGAFCGAVVGVLSPVVALGSPAYIAIKVFKHE